MPETPASSAENADAEFDAFAGSYEEALAMGLRFSGEESSYFAEGRVAALGTYLGAATRAGSVVLDYGCGTGSTTPLLRALAGVGEVVGVDVSTGLLEVARASHAGPCIRFAADTALDRESVDVAYCNGVFHHIPLAERASAVAQVWTALRPGGLFALFENNPWNPGTQLVMRSIPFDKDAIKLRPATARRLLTSAGFRVEATRFLFFFPSALRALRPIERHLERVPLGGQYVVFARKPV
jgi:SAM-dependent methyltransferase